MKKKPTVLAKQQRTQTKAWKQTSLSVPIDLLSNRQHYFRMRVAQPLEKSAKMLRVYPCMAMHPINMRHLGLFLLLTPV